MLFLDQTRHRVISDEAVSAIQYDDGDGRESTAFFSNEYLATPICTPSDEEPKYTLPGVSPLALHVF